MRYKVPQWVITGEYSEFWIRELSYEDLILAVGGFIRRNKGDVVVLNAVIPPKYSSYMFYTQVDAGAALEIIRVYQPRSYVGHESTAKLLGVEVNRGVYEPKKGDVAVVVRLKDSRRREEIDVLTENDLEFGLVWYL
jgi:hypothetical protein